MQQIFGDAANASNGSTVRTITFFFMIDRQDRIRRDSAGRLSAC